MARGYPLGGLSLRSHACRGANHRCNRNNSSDCHVVPPWLGPLPAGSQVKQARSMLRNQKIHRTRGPTSCCGFAAPVSSGAYALSVACPLWVISGHMQCKRAYPLHIRKRTSSHSVGCNSSNDVVAVGRRCDRYSGALPLMQPPHAREGQPAPGENANDGLDTRHARIGARAPVRHKMAARHGRAGTESFRRALAARDAARGAPTRPENSGAAPWPRCSPELFVHAIDVLRGPSGRAERKRVEPQGAARPDTSATSH